MIYVLKSEKVLEKIDWENSDDTGFTCQLFFRNWLWVLTDLFLYAEDGRTEKSVI